MRTAKEEIEKLKEEVQVNKEHMLQVFILHSIPLVECDMNTNNWKLYILQYKGIAQVNESALKQMEVAHENFKVEVLINSQIVGRRYLRV